MVVMWQPVLSVGAATPDNHNQRHETGVFWYTDHSRQALDGHTCPSGVLGPATWWAPKPPLHSLKFLWINLVGTHAKGHIIDLGDARRHREMTATVHAK